MYRVRQWLRSRAAWGVLIAFATMLPVVYVTTQMTSAEGGATEIAPGKDAYSQSGGTRHESLEQKDSLCDGSRETQPQSQSAPARHRDPVEELLQEFRQKGRRLDTENGREGYVMGEEGPLRLVARSSVIKRTYYGNEDLFTLASPLVACDSQMTQRILTALRGLERWDSLDDEKKSRLVMEIKAIHVDILVRVVERMLEKIYSVSYVADSRGMLVGQLRRLLPPAGDGAASGDQGP